MLCMVPTFSVWVERRGPKKNQARKTKSAPLIEITARSEVLMLTSNNSLSYIRWAIGRRNNPTFKAVSTTIKIAYGAKVALRILTVL